MNARVRRHAPRSSALSRYADRSAGSSRSSARRSAGAASGVAATAASAALKLPGTDVQLLVDEDPNEEKAGPTFTVDSVDAFYQKHKGKLHFLFEPRNIPPGRYSAFVDPSGNVIRLIDLSREQER